MFKYLALFILIYTNSILTAEQLPREILDIKLTETLSKLKKIFNLKKEKSEEELVSAFKIDYLENSIKTYVYLFNSKIYKIKLEYEENFFQQEDWENLYDKVVLLYGLPNKVEIKQINNLITETYIWEDNNTEYIYKKSVEENKIKNFTILLIDKTLKQEILNLTPTKKFLYKIKNIF